MESETTFTIVLADGKPDRNGDIIDLAGVTIAPHLQGIVKTTPVGLQVKMEHGYSALGKVIKWIEVGEAIDRSRWQHMQNLWGKDEPEEDVKPDCVVSVERPETRIQSTGFAP